MERYQEVLIALSESRHEKLRGAPPGGEITIRLAMKLRYLGNHFSQKVTMKRYQEVMDALSEFVNKNCVGRPWWRNQNDVLSGLQ